MKRMSPVLFSTLLMVLGGLAHAQDAEKPWSEQGFCGLALRDIPGGRTVVSWIFPGPLKGEGLTAPDFDLARPDLVDAVDGRRMNAEQFKKYVRGKTPGETIRIDVRKSNARGGTIPETLDHEDEIRRVEITLESRDEWSGTIGRNRERDEIAWRPEGARTPLLAPDDPKNVLGKSLHEHDLDEPVKRLKAVFADFLEKGKDTHLMSLVAAAFEYPFALPELGDDLLNVRDPGAPGMFGAILTEQPILYAQGAMDKSDLTGAGGTFGMPGVGKTSTQAGSELAHDLVMAKFWYDLILVEDGTKGIFHESIVESVLNEAFAKKCLALLRVPKTTFYLSGDQTKEHLEVMRQSIAIDWYYLPNCLLPFERDSTQEDLKKSFPGDPPIENLATMPLIDPPAEIATAVDGKIIEAHHEKDIGWIIVGSHEANRYDMAMLAGVYDPGGDDEYYATDLRLGHHAIIDLAGDDLYTGTPEQGPGGALLGVSFIDDRAGNDRYEGEMLSAGAAMYGVSLLLDRGGNDVYIGTEWSLGAACYGAGMIIDLGNGNDEYLGDFLCQGVGGPRGFGAIIDENGRDLYRANGPTPSAYGTAGVYQSFSQGIGFGYRNYAAGGIGMINDLGGDDRYEAGEFAQGGAYYYGLGILHDARGRDLYYGNRYGQGFGVHQAIGMLVDDEGDDTYWSMTAASQGAAWDIGVGMLLDRTGNDSYQCDGLGQGGASMQGIAMLIDLEGNDRYSATGGAIQGFSGGNSYHYHETGAFSFSLLMDLGGGNDWYSTKKPNNHTSTQGEPNEATPQNSPQYGLFIDQ